MCDSDILSEYFKQTSGDNFFDQISCDTNSNFDSMNNEASRRSCAWIPSEQTRNHLIQVATHVNSPVHITEDNMRFCKPKLILKASSLIDPLDNYIKEEDRVPMMSIKDVTSDDRGLRKLIQAKSYHAALELTENLLSVYSEGKHTLTSVQLWFTRIAILVKANYYEEAFEESNYWWNFDTPDLYLQYYPTFYGGRVGSMVPFSFRLLVAEIPQFIKSTSNEDYMTFTLDRLFSILQIIKKILSNLDKNLSEDGSMIELSMKDKEKSKTLWIQREIRVKHSIINCAIHYKKYILAFDMLNQLLVKPRISLTETEKVALHSAIGRILLQSGDIITSKKYFNLSNQILNSITTENNIERIPTITTIQQNNIEKDPQIQQQNNTEIINLLKYHQQIDTGLIYVSENNYIQAKNIYEKLLKQFQEIFNWNSNENGIQNLNDNLQQLTLTNQQNNFNNILQRNNESGLINFNKTNEINKNNYLINIFILIVNNLSLCELYLGNLNQSIKILENYFLNLNNIKYFNLIFCEYFFMNICAYYNLYSIDSEINKYKLIQIINQNQIYRNQKIINRIFLNKK